MAEKMMYIPNDETQNYNYNYNKWIWTLNIMIQQIKIQYKYSKLFSQRIIKRYYKTLGTSVINSPMSPPSLKNIWNYIFFNQRLLSPNIYILKDFCDVRNVKKIWVFGFCININIFNDPRRYKKSKHLFFHFAQMRYKKKRSIDEE